MVQPIDQQPQVKAQRYRLAATALFALACAVQILRGCALMYFCGAFIQPS